MFFIVQGFEFGSTHTAPEEFENEGFTLKIKPPEMFSVVTAPEEFKNATVTGHFGFLFEENSGKENHIIIVSSSFLKSSVFKIISIHAKTQSCRFQIPSV